MSVDSREQTGVVRLKRIWNAWRNDRQNSQRQVIFRSNTCAPVRKGPKNDNNVYPCVARHPPCRDTKTSFHYNQPNNHWKLAIVSEYSLLNLISTANFTLSCDVSYLLYNTTIRSEYSEHRSLGPSRTTLQQNVFVPRLHDLRIAT